MNARRVGSAASLGFLLALGCSTTTIGGPSFGSGPPIPADQVGAPCTGVGTSPGEVAAFTQADCPAGICVADMRTSIDSYCTADCEAHSCPSGYACKAVTSGVAKHACLVDGSSGDDAGAANDSGAADAPGPDSDAASTSDARPEGGGQCAPPVAACHADAECCAADHTTCAHGQCCVGSVTNGNYCGYDGDCCSGHCGANNDCCSGANQACTYDADCCTGMHCGGLAPGGTGSTCCADPGKSSHCTKPTECCGQETCGTILVGDAFHGFTPEDGHCCIKPGDSCTASEECCTGPNQGGVQCSQGSCCLSREVKCTKDAECCGGTCRSDGTCN